MSCIQVYMYTLSLQSPAQDIAQIYKIIHHIVIVEINAISSDTHQLHAKPMLHFTIIIIRDTVVRQTRNNKHEK